MKRILESLNQQSSAVTLAEDEKAMIRESLLAYVKENPVKEAIPSPFVRYRAILSPKFLAGAIIVVVLVAGSSVSYVAAKTLPGDTLYPFKVGVNERVKSWFAVTSAAKAELEVEFATKRLIEAEELEARGPLNDDARHTIAIQFNSHVDALEVRLNSMDEENEDRRKIVEDISKGFENSIKTHASVFDRLSTSTVVATTTTSTTITIGSSTSATSTTASSTSKRNRFRKIHVNKEDGEKKNMPHDAVQKRESKSEDNQNETQATTSQHVTASTSLQSTTSHSTSSSENKTNSSLEIKSDIKVEVEI